MKRLTVLSVVVIVAGLAALLLGNGLAFGQDLPPGPTTVYRSTLSGLTLSGEFDLSNQINEFAPGAASRLHTHSGPALVTVLEGEMAFAPEGQPEKVFRAGESWVETPGEYHVVASRGTTPARVSAASLVPKGAQRVIPKPGGETPPILPRGLYTATLPGITQPGEFELVNLILDFAPGSATPLHTHGGPGVVLVLEGELSNAVEGKPEQIVKTGESWVEMPGEYAVVSNKGVTNARVSFAVVLPKGAPLTTVRQQPTATATATATLTATIEPTATTVPTIAPTVEPTATAVPMAQTPVPVEQPPVAPVEQPAVPGAVPPVVPPAETIGMPRTGGDHMHTLLLFVVALGLLFVALGRLAHARLSRGV